MQRFERPLYFMVKPPPEIARLVAALPRAFRNWDLLHITLLPLGDRLASPAERVSGLLQIAAGITSAPFRVVFDQIIRGARTVALCGSEPMRGAQAFQAMLVETLARHGFSLRPRYRFVPHITLDYRGDGLGSEPIDPISWLVEEFMLVESVVGEGRHIEHGRWPLRAKPHD